MRNKFFLNKNPAGKLNSFVMGFMALADGLTRIFTLGFVSTTFQLDHSRDTVSKAYKKARNKQNV